MNSEIKTLEGKMNAAGLRVGIVCARFNSIFVEQLLSGAVDTLLRHGAAARDIAVAWVPGSFEIPLVIKKMAQSGKYDAVIALGVVIQGSTQHALMINSVVTTENIEQAIERSGSKAGNRGASAAASAIEMANLLRELPAAGKK